MMMKSVFQNTLPLEQEVIKQMEKDFTLAVTGDSIINRRISVHSEERFLALVKILRDADVSYTHFENIVHDYDGDEIYPAAEPGRTPMRSPRYVVEELKWAGFDIVSLAHNHCLDYSYGGLFSTWKALNEANMPHAGTGRNLAEAREPVYLDTRKGRLALVSMTSSFAPWGRAGEARPDVKGRPGVNPLRYYQVVDADTMENLTRLASKFGWKAQRTGSTLLLNTPGSENSNSKFVLSDQPGVSTVVDESDAEGNIRSIREARRQADYVLVHLHNHEWDPEKGLYAPPKFVSPFARACIDAGADLFIAEGCHHPLRGIELYRGKPIFYDLGDLMMMNNTITRLPTEVYSASQYGLDIPAWQATPADLYDSREKRPRIIPRPEGFVSERVPGAAVVAVCTFKEEWKISEIVLYPVSVALKPRPKSGFPMLADRKTAAMIITFLAELSAPYGTKIEFKDGVGIIKL
jgi:poly-gamma-glutamate capsule biosynthesis protein CapA/YwtB (metallophosphatase superfamily)